MPEAATANTGAGDGAGASTGGTGQSGGGSKPWFDGKVDADLIGHWDNKGWKKDDPVNIAIEATKAARELQRHFGVPAEQLIKLPKDNSNEAEWNPVFERLGVPKEAKDYDFTALKAPDGSELDTAFTDKMRNTLHAARVPKDKASSVIKAVLDHVAATDAADAAAIAASRTEQLNKLQKDWGTNFEFNRLTAMQGARRLGLDREGIDALESLPGMGYTKVMEIMRKIGAGTTEATFHDGGQTGAQPTTRQGAEARLNDLMADKEWAGRLLAGDAKAKQEFAALMQLKVGEAA